jgi:hypothetical protein
MVVVGGEHAYSATPSEGMPPSQKSESYFSAGPNGPISPIDRGPAWLARFDNQFHLW